MVDWMAVLKAAQKAVSLGVLMVVMMVASKAGKLAA